MAISFSDVEVSSLPVLADILNYYVTNTTVTFHKELLRPDEMKEKVFLTSLITSRT